MRLSLLTPLFLFASFTVYSQGAYLSGYIILPDGEKVEGLVRNVDHTPDKIKFKESEDADILTYTAEEIREFGFSDRRFGSFRVEIDRTPDSHRHLTSFRNPNNEIRTLFLKYVVDGEMDLLEYKEPRLERFFYKKPDTDSAVQLVYKRFYADARYVSENNFYKQQLLNEVNCDSKKAEDLDRMSYTEGKLISYFVEFNKCAYPSSALKEKDKRIKVMLSVRGGVDLLKMTIWKYDYDPYLDYPTSVSPLFGFEGELFSNAHRRKGALLFGGAYHRLTEELTIDDFNYKIDYPSIEWSFGYRYYMNITQEPGFYLNVMVVIDSPLNPTFTINDEPFLNIKSRNTYAVGGGIKLTNRFKLDARISFEHEILDNYIDFFSDYNSMAFTATYTLFQRKN